LLNDEEFMTDLSQDNSPGKLTTALGDTKLVLSRFNGSESLSELFEFRIEAISTEQNVDFKSALGKSVTVRVKAVDGKDRFFSGLLTEARWAGLRQGGLFAHQLVIKPWLYFLSLTSDCKIFSQKSAKDIIKQVFSDRGFNDFRDELKSSYPTIEYCVQYRETDLDFVSRLMEQWGIYYFFEHSDGKHMMVLADMKASHNPVPGLSSVTFMPTNTDSRQPMQHIEEWMRGRSVESGAFVLNDYDYNKPSSNLLANSNKSGGYAHDSMEMYDYIGEYNDRDVGTNFAKIENDAAQSLDDRRSGTGTAVSLFPGGLVSLEKHPTGSENQEYLIVGCSHFFDAQQYLSSGGGDGAGYLGNFEFTPSATQFRAELDTERPCIAGVQSALVVGKKGEEIDVDELGRILVQFYWDRKKKQSRRIRVAQFWAGKTRGAIFWPRIGDEVLVQYEEGDPDRPLVVGSVYNGDWSGKGMLPGKKNNSGIQTQSTKNSSGYNMLLFNDTAGSEKLKIRAQKDLMFKALNDEVRDIGHDQTETVKGDETLNIGTVTGGGEFQLNVAKSAAFTVDKALAIPFTQISMDSEQIIMTVLPYMTTITITAAGVMIESPTITLQAMAAITLNAPIVNVPGMLNVGFLNATAGTASGLPLV
jgi:type VI secretion system secreted protein VgrG